AKTPERAFVIETHSDYMMDRVRIEIMKGTIPPENVTILFFERGQSESHIHQLFIKDSGDILDAPHNFRSFFLDEQSDLLGIS
ncbi:MAG: DUF3696 domain-containing protein, partial [Proteobacteria bacterium]